MRLERDGDCDWEPVCLIWFGLWWLSVVFNGTNVTYSLCTLSWENYECHIRVQYLHIRFYDVFYGRYMDDYHHVICYNNVPWLFLRFDVMANYFIRRVYINSVCAKLDLYGFVGRYFSLWSVGNIYNHFNKTVTVTWL